MNEIIRLGARLRAARKAAGFKTSKSFLKKYKIPASTYSQHESGARKPDDETLGYYSKILEVNFNWLKLGEGKPYSICMPTQKNIIDNELIDLKKLKSPTFYSLNKIILSEILEKLLKLHNIDTPSKIIKLIADKSSNIYQNVTSATSTKKDKMAMIKYEISAYKKTVSKS